MQSIELFAGGGGLALGLHEAGFSPVALVERDADSCRTLHENWRQRVGSSVRLSPQDVRYVDFQQWEDRVELVSGGPPCQPFSIAGKHKGYNDQRDMFPSAVNVVKTIRPKAFIFENVRGLLRKSFESYFSYILLQLQYPELSRSANQTWKEHLASLEAHHTGGSQHGLNYRVVFQKVNAADYGVAQTRQRVVIVGFRSDIQEPWSFPQSSHCEEALDDAKWNTGSYWSEHGLPRSMRQNAPDGYRSRVSELPSFSLSERWRTVRDAIGDLPDPRSAEALRVPNHRFQPGARKYAGHTGSELDQPGKTLKAGDHGVPGGENMIAFPDGTVRYLTVRESARLQGFPDSYLFPTSWTESMRQVGNAVPVTLARVIGKSVSDTLQKHARRHAKAK